MKPSSANIHPSIFSSISICLQEVSSEDKKSQEPVLRLVTKRLTSKYKNSASSRVALKDNETETSFQDMPLMCTKIKEVHVLVVRYTIPSNKNTSQFSQLFKSIVVLSMVKVMA